MKYLVIILLLLLSTFYSMAQFSSTTIGGMTTKIGRPNNAWIPIEVSGVTYKLDINYIASDKINSISISNDSLFSTANGVTTFVGIVGGTSSGGGGGGTGSSNVNIYNISKTFDGTQQDIALYIGTALVAGIQVVSPTGQPFDANGSDLTVSKKDGDTLRLHYAAAPQGVVNFQLTLLGAIPSSAGARVKYGAKFGLGTSTLNMLALANTQLLNTRVVYNGGSTTDYSTYTHAGYNTILSYNTAAPVAGNYTALPTDTTAFKAKMDSLLTANPSNNLLGVAMFDGINNIQHGIGYWNPVSAKNVINLLNAGANVLHAHGLLAFDGGFETDILRFMVWEDYVNRGFTDSAASFLSRAFPAGTTLTGWRGDTAHGYRIVFMDSLLAALPTIRTDRVNLHWYETVRAADSTSSSIDPLAFKQVIWYLRRKSGKKVITTEIGLNNNSTAFIMTQLIDACQSLFIATGDMEYVTWYSGAPSPYSLSNADASLTGLGTAFKNKIISVQN